MLNVSYSCDKLYTTYSLYYVKLYNSIAYSRNKSYRSIFHLNYESATSPLIIELYFMVNYKSTPLTLLTILIVTH